MWSGGDGSTYHAAWIHATGVLYAVRHGDGLVETLARFDDEEELRAYVRGWQRAIARPDSIRWLRSHATGQLDLEQAA